MENKKQREKKIGLYNSLENFHVGHTFNIQKRHYFDIRNFDTGKQKPKSCTYNQCALGFYQRILAKY